MKTCGATSFAKAILLALITSVHPSLQQGTTYDPSTFSDWKDLRSCVQSCLSDGAYSAFADSSLGCALNACYCRADIIPQAVSIVSSCASSLCSNTNDVATATSFYEAYCSSATQTSAVALITTNTETAAPASTVAGDTTATPAQTTSSGGNINNNNNINIGKGSADARSTPSKIVIGVAIPLVILVVAGFMWYLVRRQRRRRRLTRQGQSREEADRLENRSPGYKAEQSENKPELGASEAQQPGVQQGWMRSTVAHEVAGVSHNSLSELHGTWRDAVEVSGNPIHEFGNSRP